MNGILKNISVDLIKKYNVTGPYYTSYPTLSEWTDTFSYGDYVSSMEDLCRDKRDVPLFLYVHFPFCARQCYYCLCNSIVTKERSIIQKYLSYLFREIDLFVDFFKRHSFVPKFKMIHLGGGSPTLMNKEEFELLLTNLQNLVNLEELDEFAIEIDARTATKEKLRFYSEKGINRISVGIQDFEPAVQKAINRIQPPGMVEELLTPEIRKRFKSINFDLIYGLPLQNRASFRRTTALVKEFSPDRITLLKYAHVPERRKHQRLIKEEELPDFIEQAMIFIDATNEFLEDGYEYVGIDHFAKREDTLAQAMKKRRVWRNFIGFTPGGTHNIVGIGITSSSSFNNFYTQNLYTLSEYYESLDNKKFPILRGFKLNRDDLIRRDIINKILCNSSLDFSDIEENHDIEFDEYFSKEISSLRKFVEDGMLEFNNHSFRVTLEGRMFIRHICKVFDKYLTGNKPYRITGP